MKEKNKNENKVEKKNNNHIKRYLNYYKDNYMRKQIYIFIICLVLFLIAFTIGMSTLDFNMPFKKEINELANINLIQIQFIFVMILTPILALIPFVKKLSIITVFYSYFMAFNVANMFYLPTHNKMCLSIFVVLSLFALSLNIMLSFELSEKVNGKFTKLLSTKAKKNNKKTNVDKVFQGNEKNENFSLKKKYIVITFVLCMIVTIVNLVITKFI